MFSGIGTNWGRKMIQKENRCEKNKNLHKLKWIKMWLKDNSENDIIVCFMTLIL